MGAGGPIDVANASMSFFLDLLLFSKKSQRKWYRDALIESHIAARAPRPDHSFAERPSEVVCKDSRARRDPWSLDQKADVGLPDFSS